MPAYHFILFSTPVISSHPVFYVLLLCSFLFLPSQYYARENVKWTAVSANKNPDRGKKDPYTLYEGPSHLVLVLIWIILNPPTTELLLKDKNRLTENTDLKFHIHLSVSRNYSSISFFLFNCIIIHLLFSLSPFFLWPFHFKISYPSWLQFSPSSSHPSSLPFLLLSSLFMSSPFFSVFLFITYFL